MFGTQTDWVEETIKLGYIQNHQISVSGGSKNVNYYASGSFLDEKGIVITDRYKKFNLNAKVDAKINDKLEFGVNVNAVVDSNALIVQDLNQILIRYLEMLCTSQ